ncbi:copper homeostasis periplasmic binding protein CopC [uncultured Rhodoblastus sp.]|uniref:copper homeostasis periplasmic binding protein CopC n=1 Tax=uncultured Rhodoblastus sp. TaxID=543037 RepID=UPI0026000DDB|nr:copper homeostasis periplasmic binding protein CopC [uncultured Rhodoblastus sp.]
MKYFRTLVLAALACVFAAASASAHAFLDHAVPAVGATVSGSPGEIELVFTQDIVPAFSGAEILVAGGGAVPSAKAAASAGNPAALRLRLGQALKSGVYIVNWHVVSVDTHRSSGSYKFTVAP